MMTRDGVEIPEIFDLGNAVNKFWQAIEYLFVCRHRQMCGWNK